MRQDPQSAPDRRHWRTLENLAHSGALQPGPVAPHPRPTEPVGAGKHAPNIGVLVGIGPPQVRADRVDDDQPAIGRLLDRRLDVLKVAHQVDSSAIRPLAVSAVDRHQRLDPRYVSAGCVQPWADRIPYIVLGVQEDNPTRASAFATTAASTRASI